MKLPTSFQQGIGRLQSGTSRTQRVWGMSLGIFLVALAIGLFGVQSPWQQKRLTLEKGLGEEKQRGELLLQIDRQKKELQKLEEKILLPGGTPVLTSEVTRLASKTGLRIESVVPKPEVSFGPFTKFQIEVQATCTYSDLLKFLRLAEQHEPLLKVDQLEMGEPPLATEGILRPGGQGSSAAAEATLPKGKLLISALLRREKGS